MELAQILGGGNARIMKYPVSSTIIAGIPLLIPAAGGNGLTTSTATGAANMVGVSLDAAVYATAQNSDNSDPEGQVSVIVNPDAVWRAKLSGGTANNTTLAAQTITTLSSTGLVITTAAEWATPTFDEGTVWGITGSNAGIIRKITAVSTTAGTVTVAFPHDTVVGDIFARLNCALFTAGVTMTATLDQLNAAVAVAAGAAALVPINVRGLLRDNGDEGLTNSFVDLIAGDHALGGRPT
jgi:hypothetical protein